jgi:hypothetical protein
MLPMAVAAAQEAYISVPEGNKIVAASHRAWRADLSESKDWGTLPQGDAAWTLTENILGDYFVRFASSTWPESSAASFTEGMLRGLVQSSMPAHLLRKVAASERRRRHPCLPYRGGCVSPSRRSAGCRRKCSQGPPWGQHAVQGVSRRDLLCAHCHFPQPSVPCFPEGHNRSLLLMGEAHKGELSGGNWQSSHSSAASLRTC